MTARNTILSIVAWSIGTAVLLGAAAGFTRYKEAGDPVSNQESIEEEVELARGAVRFYQIFNFYPGRYSDRTAAQHEEGLRVLEGLHQKERELRRAANNCIVWCEETERWRAEAEAQLAEAVGLAKKYDIDGIYQDFARRHK